MKYIICPLLYLLLWLVLTTIYCIRQLLYFSWHLKFNKKIKITIDDEQYYYKTQRIVEQPNLFMLEETYKEYITPKNSIIYLIWILKYGLSGEVTELSKKEKEAFNKWIKYENIKIS